jgi:hypothetical protein
MAHHSILKTKPSLPSVKNTIVIDQTNAIGQGNSEEESIFEERKERMGVKKLETQGESMNEKKPHNSIKTVYQKDWREIDTKDFLMDKHSVASLRYPKTSDTPQNFNIV